jgi:hypothetical protein
VGCKIGNGSAGKVACTGAHGKHLYQQDVEWFAYYSSTIGAYHIVAGRHGRRKRAKSDHYRGAD